MNIPVSDVPYVSVEKIDTSVLFADRENTDLYWEALVQAAKNNKEEAKKIVTGLKLKSYPVISFPWKESQPQNIEAFFDKLFLSTVYRDPLTLTFLGLFESVGIREHNAFLTDISPKAMRRNLEEQKVGWATLQKYSLEELAPAQAVSYKIFSWKLRHVVEGEKFLFHEYFINQMEGVVQHLTAAFLLLHKLEVAEDVDYYLVRLGKIPDHFKQAIETIEHQKEKGIVPPRFAIEKVINTITQFIEVPPEKNVFYMHLEEQIKQIKDINRDQKLKGAKNVIKEKVYPAYQMLKTHLTKLLKIAKTNHGVWALPNGDAYYAYMLKHHTTTDLTAEEIHHLGLKEVKRIQEEMRLVLKEQGIIDESKEVGELVAKVGKEGRFYYPNTDQGRKECLAQFEAILERCRKHLWPLFDLKPQSKVVLKAVPKHEEEGASGAYYYPASIDGSRPGAFYVNLRNLNELPKYRMETLAIHEAEPGHHFQCAIENEMDIPALRKVGHYTAYTEGWALYAEKLAYEQGFYSTSFDKLGHLRDELLRAVRLVVDTGIHKKQWSREQAIKYMEKITGDAHDSIVTEIERYFVFPGQACSYKIGQLKILDLRQKAKDRLKDRFDIRAFHNVILKLGSVPLSVLEEAVEEYIKKVVPSLCEPRP